MPTLRLNKKFAPTLYRHDSASDTTWTLFKELAGVVFDIRPDTKRGPYEPEYTNAQLRFLPMGEAIARAWLNRPQKTPLPGRMDTSGNEQDFLVRQSG